jgi:acetolactate synthase-1/2/3 large subunit
MYLIDAVARATDVDFQPVHHEEFAGVCADGYARSGRKFGVAFATTGPGSAHLFTAAAAAWQDSVPLLLIAGQVKTQDSSRLLGINVRQNGTFEFDSIGAFSHITKKTTIVKNAREAIEAIDEGIIICQSLRPGPVLIEIPLDVQAMEISNSFDLGVLPSSSIYSIDNSDEGNFKREVSKALEHSQRPILLFGAGVVRSQSQSLVNELYSMSEIPYVVTQFSRAVGSLAHNHYLGSPGVKANRSANIAIAEADLVIAIGTSLHQQVIGWNDIAFKELDSFKIWTEIDSNTRESRKHLVDLAFNVETSQALKALIEVCNARTEWKKSIEVWRQRATELRESRLLHYPDHENENGRLCLYKTVSILSARAERFKAVTTDAGIAWYVVAQHFFPAKNSYFISSGSFGAMGMALPLAIGSAKATSQATLCVTGDGSLMTCLQEFATLASSRAPVLLVINSNNGYVSIRATHDKFFEGRKIGTDSSNGVLIPSFREIAGLFGIPYAVASTEKELERILDSEICNLHNLPLILEVKSLEKQSVEPVIISKLNRATGEMESGSLIDLFPEDLLSK